MVAFRAGLIQLNSQDDIVANIHAVEQYIREAVKQGATFICTPENTFYMKEPGSSGYPDVSMGIERCRVLAKELGAWILIGSAQIPTASGRSNNRSILINDQGQIVAKYDKIHLFDVTLKNGEAYNESARVEGGQAAVGTDTPWGKVGMTVCYDLRFPQLFRMLAKSGAEIITVPAAFTYTTGSAHWHVLLRARAIEDGCFILAPAQCGCHPGKRRTYGHSLVVAPWGEIIAEASEDTTGVTIAEINMDKVQEARSMIPALQHDRQFSL